MALPLKTMLDNHLITIQAKQDTLVSDSKGVIRSIGMHLAFPSVWFSTSSSVASLGMVLYWVAGPGVL